jgi:acyl-CoA hydrolase
MQATVDFELRQRASETRIVKAIFPNTTNHHNTLFGGQALSWMDEAAFISATRFCRKALVTVSTDRIDFKEPIPAGTFVELVARVAKVGRTSLTVRVDICIENMYADGQHQAISGEFKFVAIDENRKPTPVFDIA